MTKHQIRRHRRQPRRFTAPSWPKSPEQPDALHMLGVIAQQAGNPDLALKLIEVALAKNPNFSQAWYNRCIILRALGRADDALQSAREAAGARSRTLRRGLGYGGFNPA